MSTFKDQYKNYYNIINKYQIEKDYYDCFFVDYLKNLSSFGDRIIVKILHKKDKLKLYKKNWIYFPFDDKKIKKLRDNKIISDTLNNESYKLINKYESIKKILNTNHNTTIIDTNKFVQSVAINTFTPNNIVKVFSGEPINKFGETKTKPKMIMSNGIDLIVMINDLLKLYKSYIGYFNIQNECCI